MKPITFDNDRDRYDSIRFERSGGVLEMMLQTGGKSLVFDRTVHE